MAAINSSETKKLSLVDRTLIFWEGKNLDADTNVKAETGISNNQAESIEQQYGIELPETFKRLYQQSNGTAGLDPFRFMFWPLEIIMQNIALKEGVVWISFCEYFGLYTFAIGIDTINQQRRIYRFDSDATLVADSFDNFLQTYLYQHEKLLLPVDQLTTDSMEYCQNKVKVLGALKNRILQHQGESLFQELMLDFKTFFQIKIDQQEHLMQCLEGWWDHNKFVASYLMARLLPEAEKIKDNHAVCNAIELYLSSDKCIEVSSALELIISEGISPSFVMKYTMFQRK